MALRELTKPALTPREEQIAALVAEGLTNREIAGRLSISERTADRHLEHIRQKLGVNSRARIASWYVEQLQAAAVRSRPQVAAWVPAEGLREPVLVAQSAAISEESPKVLPRPATRWLWAAGGATAAIGALTVAIVVLLPALMAATLGPRITTFAGTGVAAYSPDENLATSTDLEEPSGVALSQTGDLYIAEGYRIRRVGSDARVVTVAGNGHSGFSGDGGSATVASLSLSDIGTAELVGMAIDRQGNLYIADTQNDKVRKVTPDGIISTVAGAGTPGHCLRSPPPLAVGDGRPGVSAVLCQPHGLLIDGQGDLLIADTGDNRVRKLAPDGMISTVAGTGQAGLSPDGTLAVDAELNAPEGLAADKEGNIYIADSGNEVVRRIGPDGVIRTVAGNGSAGFSGDGRPAVNARLNLPLGLAFDELGNLYVADSANNTIRVIDHSGTIATLVGNQHPGWSGDNGLASSAQLNDPVGLAILGSKELYIADLGNNRIRLVRRTGG